MDANAFSRKGQPGWISGPVSPLNGTRIFLAGAFVLAVAAWSSWFDRAHGSSGVISTPWMFVLGAYILMGILHLLAFILLFTAAGKRLEQTAGQVFGWVQRLGYLNLLAVVLLWMVFVGYLYFGYDKAFSDFAPRVWMFWLVVGAGAFFLTAFWKRPAYWHALLALLIVYGFGIKVISYAPEVTSFPFSLGWSEASRYYYASLPYAKSLFGIEIPLSSLHPSRYLLQSLPFLLPNGTLLLSRLWQVILWIVLPVLTGLALARRFQLSKPQAFFGALWAGLFMLQGPVYYHLLLCVIPIFWAFDSRRFWKSLVIVALASIWAGLSRVNWIPVPAMLAVAIYVMERPACEVGDVRHTRGTGALRLWKNYLWKPAVWGIVGLAVAYASQEAYVFVSGHEDTSAFSSSFTSALLFYRLLPNPTYPLGVLPTILLVTAPQLIWLGYFTARKGREWHLLRPLALAVMLLVLFIGGLVVSSKIGGGSNIHNLDAYLVLLLLITAYSWMGRFASEDISAARPVRRSWAMLLLMVLVPVIFNMQISNPFARRNMAQAEFDINKLRPIVQEYAAQGEVLFITQRQLLVFNLIPGVPLVPDYELLTLSEMAISNNQSYLERFYADLRSHRFALIVVDPQNGRIQDPLKEGFAEENNAWVTHISVPLMRYYQTELNFDTQGIDLLVPRQ